MTHYMATILGLGRSELYQVGNQFILVSTMENNKSTNHKQTTSFKFQ